MSMDSQLIKTGKKKKKRKQSLDINQSHSE